MSPLGIMNASELEGKEVIGLNGWKIGNIEDTVLDPETWQATHLDVGLRGAIAEELGMKETFKTSHILIDIKRVQGIGDVVTLNISKEDLLRKLTTVEAGAHSDVTAPTASQ